MPKSKEEKKVLSVTQVASAIRRQAVQGECLKALGLGKIGRTVRLESTPQILGLINKIQHLVRVEAE